MVIKPSKSAAENKDDLARRIGLKLKELRKSMGMTMKRLVEETGLSAPPSSPGQISPERLTKRYSRDERRRNSDEGWEKI
ncbi:MAG: hypothetical protein PHU49_10015 [Syntrophorhabdaceae bacterium]|nr:hypothetical protein [Syntrophorhabdaceae bacterium]MDD5244341.1 hypothetical protein [Syntrophorhabdaceae bacterium]